ncbi:MAG TPA: cysteine-rich CWC family protein [Noviherbaspirillum sp.]|uniref:cysteine-rich CWC family protein n=1 Tax=Noviherbaspirillum sp. TaxID=1926288 RepID=UPI002D62C954|nr:cysteine-rich CWC family protein [Noviherbaspirillum sp.]HYD96584.1 cysteine-rich CWC family protein [Noviherbaspirillum sp.]
MEPKPNNACPLCGGPNGCAPAAAGSFDVPCWCTTAKVDAAVLARVPEALRGQACICAKCAARPVTSET